VTNRLAARMALAIAKRKGRFIFTTSAAVGLF
jgi:hypothetical protein